MASIYQRKDSKWLYVSYVQGGKRLAKKTPYRIGQEELADRFAAELTRKEREDLARGEPTVLTVCDWAEQWFQDRETKIKSIKDDRSRIRTHVLPAIGHLELARVRKSDVQALFDGLRAKCKAGELASGTVRSIYAATVVMFDDAVAKDLVAASPVFLTSHTLPPVTKVPTLCYSIAEVEAILSATEIPADRRMTYGLLFFLGARFGEAAALRWSDLDETAKPLGRIAINKSWSNSRQETGETKTGTSRNAPVHPVLAAMLKRWREAGFPALFGCAPEASDLIIPSREGKERSGNHMLKKLRQDLKRLDFSQLERRKLHAFRTAYISALRNADVNKEKVRAVTHGKRASGDVIDAFYTAWDWSTLCDAVLSIPFSTEFYSGGNSHSTAVLRSAKGLISKGKMAGWTGLEDGPVALPSATEQPFPEPFSAEELVDAIERCQAQAPVEAHSTVEQADETASTSPSTAPEPVDIGDILASAMPPGWHQLPIGKTKSTHNN